LSTNVDTVATFVDKHELRVNNQQMAKIKKTDPDRDAYYQAVREHIVHVLDSGVTRREIANELDVTRAAISSYVLGRTTPKPYIIERLLLKWPTQLPFRGVPFGVGAYAGPAPKPEPVPYQRDLFSNLSSIKPEDLKIRVERASATDVELRVSIRIAG
jgi:transcriptional regulator with XRE-family HTH domain